MLGYLSADIICSEMRIVSRERSSRKTVSSEELMMFKDKYPMHMEAIVFVLLQICFAKRIWGISPDIPQFKLGYIQSRGALRLIACDRKIFDGL